MTDDQARWHEYAAASFTQDGGYNLIHRSRSPSVTHAIRMARRHPISVVVERVAPDGAWHLWTDTRRGWSNDAQCGGTA